VRGRGLLIGVELDPDVVGARQFCEMLMTRGLLTKDTHDTVIRFAPPLVISESEVDHALDIIRDGFKSLPAPDGTLGGAGSFDNSQPGRLAA